MTQNKKTNVVLVLYHHTLEANAPTIMEYVEAFKNYSKFEILNLNIAKGFPRGLSSIEFSAIILHYSLFTWFPARLNKSFINYLKLAHNSCKVAFIQDEQEFCQERIKLINEIEIDIIYTILQPKDAKLIYKQNTNVKKIRQALLPGYVCDNLIKNAQRYAKDFNIRTIDVGYRARKLSYLYGRGAQEKSDIADRFIEFTRTKNIKIDISTDENKRIYGEKWYEFLSNCKFVLGVYAGVTIFDTSGAVKNILEKYLKEKPLATFEEASRDILQPFENKIKYRFVSPRTFECAAFKTCMILFEDEYQNILKADRHYIPLKKDFSNIDEVLHKMKDERYVEGIISNAYNDLIASGKYHYTTLISVLDADLLESGCSPTISPHGLSWVNKFISKDEWLRTIIVKIASLRSKKFFGKRYLKKIAKKIGYRNS